MWWVQLSLARPVVLRSQQMAWPCLPVQAGERAHCVYEQLRTSTLRVCWGVLGFVYCFCLLFYLVWFLFLCSSQGLNGQKLRRATILSDRTFLISTFPWTIRTKKATASLEGNLHNTLQNVFLQISPSFHRPMYPSKKKITANYIHETSTGDLREWVTYLLLVPWKADWSIRSSYHWNDRQGNASGSTEASLGWHRTRIEKITEQRGARRVSKPHTGTHAGESSTWEAEAVTEWDHKTRENETTDGDKEDYPGKLNRKKNRSWGDDSVGKTTRCAKHRSPGSILSLTIKQNK